MLPSLTDIMNTDSANAVGNMVPNVLSVPHADNGNCLKHDTGRALEGYPLLSRKQLTRHLPVSEEESAMVVSNAIRNNEELVQSIKSHVYSNHVASLNYTRSQEEYATRYVVKPEDIDSLQESFPMFHITLGATHAATNHPYARERRALESKFIFQHVIKYNENVRLHDDYDVFVKDVGGSPILHDVNKRSRVHVCLPVLGIKDHIRMANWNDHVQQNAMSSKLRNDHPIVKSYIENNPCPLLCHEKSQFCTVKAPICTFIHSTYDMSLYDIGASIDNAGATTAYIIFIFSPEIVVNREGRLETFKCSFEKFKEYGKEFIKFSFDTDASPHYIHSLDTYYSLVKLNYFHTPSGRVFAMEHQYKDHTMFVTMRETAGNVIHSELIHRTLRFEDDDDYIFVLTYRYNTLWEDPMEPVRIKCSKSFFYNLLAFAFASKDSKFTVDNLKQYAQSMNKRVMVGTTAVSGERMDPMVVVDLCVAAYIMVYNKNYESSKVVQVITADEQAVRLFSGRCRILKILFKAFCANRSKYKGHYLSGEKISEIQNFDVSQSTADKSFYSLIDKICALMPDFRRKYPLAIEGARSFTITEYVNTTEYHEPVSTYLYALPPSAGDVAFSTKALAVMSASAYAKKNPAAYDLLTKCADVDENTGLPRSLVVPAPIDGNFTVLQTPGDGNCFFHAVAHALGNGTTADYLRSMVRDSIVVHYLCTRLDPDTSAFTSDPDAVTKLLSRLSPVVDPSDEATWADSTVILATSLVLGVSICIHSGQVMRIYNPAACATIKVRNAPRTTGTLIHVSHESNHFSRMCEQYTDSGCLVDSFFADDEMAEPTDEEYSSFACFVQPLCRDTDGRLITSHLEYANGFNPYKRLGKYGYSSYYGPMLKFAYCNGLSLDLSDTDIKVLDIDQRNGSSSEFFCDSTLASVTSGFQLATSECKFAKQNTYRRPDRTVMFKKRSGDASFPLLNLENGYFDLVSLNPGFYTDSLSIVDHDRHDAHVSRYNHCVSKLSLGGHIIIAVPMPLSRYSMLLMQFFAANFGVVRLVKPTVVPGFLPWAFICAREKLPECPDEFPVLPPDDHVWEINMEILVEAVSANEKFKVRLDDEIANILQRSYIPFSSDLISHLKSLVPSRSVERVTGGFEGFMNLPSTDETFGPVFSRDAVRKLFPTGFARLVRDRSFDVVSEKFSRMLASEFFTEYKLSRDTARIRLLDLFTSGGFKTPFQEKYAIALYCALDCGHDFVALKLSACDMDKPLSSRLFYTTKFLPEIRMLGKLIHEALSLSASKALPSYFVTHVVADTSSKDVVRPSVTSGFFEVEERTRLFVEVDPCRGCLPDADGDDFYSFDAPDSDIHSDVQGGSVQDSPAQPSATQPVYWLPDSYTTELTPDITAAYAEDYFTTVSASVDSVTAVADNLLSRALAVVYPIRGKPDVERAQLKAIFGEKYSDSCLFVLNGRPIFGKPDNVLDKNFVYTFEPNSRVPNLTSLRAVVRVERPERKPKFQNFLYFSELEVFTDYLLNKRISSVCSSSPTLFSKSLDITATQAGPGCGKTHNILARICEDPTKRILGVMKNKENVESARIRLKKLLADRPSEIRSIVTNVDSFVKQRILSIDNVLLMSEPGPWDLVLVDEAMTMPPGKICLLAVLVNSPVHIYGDIHQCPYYCRVNGVDPKYTETGKAFPITNLLAKSYRCPNDVCYFLSPLYYEIAKALNIPVPSDKLVITSDSDVVSPTMSVQSIVSAADVVYNKDSQYITFTQSDKQTLAKRFPASKVMTIHEYQGNENPFVCIVRLTPLEVHEQPGGIFESVPHFVSGISRHTKAMVYYTVKPDDALSKIIISNRMDFQNFVPVLKNFKNL
nr:putative methyltransferase and helicase domain-containing protein [Tomato fruit blotch virus]